MQLFGDLMRKDVFISYSSVDADFVEKLAEDLRKHNFKVWLDTWDHSLGADIAEEINGGLKESGVLLVVITEKSMKSKRPKAELANKYAVEIQKDNLMVIPTIIGEVSEKDIPRVLHDKHRLNLSRDYDREINRVTNYLLEKRKEAIHSAVMPEMRDILAKSINKREKHPLSDEINSIFRKLAKADKYSPERKIDLIIRDVEFRCNKLKEEDEERQRKLDAPESKFDVWLAFLKIGEYKKGQELLDKLRYLKSTIKDPELCLDEIMLELITIVG
jgi:hypothetical protein